MKSRLLSIFALSIALIASELQAQTIIFDNQAVGGTVTSFGGGTGFPQSRTVVGDDFDTIPTPDPGDSWLVSSIDFTAILFPETPGETSAYDDIEVEVSLVDLGDSSVFDALGNPNYTAADFSNASVLGSEIFTLGSTGTFFILQTTQFSQTVNFTNPINIGDGIGTGIMFRLSDSTGATELGLLSIGYRNNGPSAAPSVGGTSFRNYRDGANNGSISSAFSFNSGIGLSYTVHATAVDETEILLGDVNLDGEVDFFDISPFISLLSRDGFLEEADVDRDGDVDFFDISPFIVILSS